MRHAFSDQRWRPSGETVECRVVPVRAGELRVQAGKESEDWSKNAAAGARRRPVDAAGRRGGRRARIAARLVDVPVLNGFCLFVKAEVVEAVGLMDEVAFPHGFGEENDFALRARGGLLAQSRRRRLRLAPQVQVLRRRDAAGAERRVRPRPCASGGAPCSATPSSSSRPTRELAEARRRVGASLTGSACGPGRLRVLFVLNPQKEHREHEFQMHGGWISIVNEALGLRDRGACAQVAMSSWLVPYSTAPFRSRRGRRALDPGLRTTRCCGRSSSRTRSTTSAAAFDVVVATLFTTVRAGQPRRRVPPEPPPGQHATRTTRSNLRE